MQTSLVAHYDELWNEALPLFEQNRFAIDPLIDAPSDDRFGLTLLFRPNPAVKQNIQAFLHELQKIEPHQYYYPDSDMHVTVMSIISCYSGFRLERVDVDSYSTLIRESLRSMKSFNIHFRGITASPSCILIQGFPADGTLEQIRNALRVNFKKTSLEQTIDKRYRQQAAHATVVRFRKEVEQSDKFIQTLRTYRTFDFGVSEINELEWILTDWYQRQNKVKLLQLFTLPG